MKDAGATRERILEAGMVEFAAYGLAGARVDRIALAAEANKNSIYRYFESKERLFTAVVQRHMERVFIEVPFTPEDLPGFAVRLFDYAIAHQELMRLMIWFGLERDTDGPIPESGTMPDKLAALASLGAQSDHDNGLSPAFVFTVITAIATAWTTVNPFWSAIDPDALNDLPALRASIARLIDRLYSD